MIGLWDHSVQHARPFLGGRSTFSFDEVHLSSTLVIVASLVDSTTSSSLVFLWWLREESLQNGVKVFYHLGRLLLFVYGALSHPIAAETLT